MADQSAPFIKLGDGKNAPELNYSIPESTSIVGNHVISVSIPEGFLNKETKERIRKNIENKRRPNFTLNLDNIVARTPSVQPKMMYLKRSDNSLIVNSEDEIRRIATENTDKLIFQRKENTYGFTNSFEIIKPRKTKIFPKILFYETIQVSNFLGNYGAGRVIKTFSLFPGEKTKISLKTYKRTSEKVNVGSSILDSVTKESVDDFENSVTNEQSLKYDESEVDILHSVKTHTESESSSEGGGGGSVLWGLVEGKGSGGSSSRTVADFEQAGEWGTRSSREISAKNVSNAVEKHSTRASSKRNIEINTSSETSTEIGEESAIE